MLDVLFVNPPSPDGDIYIRDINRSGRKSREEMIWPQTSLAYLAAMLNDKYSVEIIDCIAEGMDWKTFEKHIRKIRPRYLVTNIISSTLTNDMYTAFLAKSFGAKTIGIGPHVTHIPRESLEAFPSLDFIMRGEAELTVRELIDACESKGDLGKVKGVAFRKNGEVFINEERPFVENLDDLPLPLHNLLPLKKYYRPFFGNYTFIITSRGCPFSCTFCRQIVMWKGKFRQRSVDSVIKEVKLLKGLGLNSLLLHADTFTVNKEWVIEFCKRIISEKLDFRWACNTHISSVDEETAVWMKKAGCWMIAPGIESASQLVLDNVKKGITVSKIVEVVNMLHRNGIEVWAYFVMGLPGETRESIRETIKLSKRLPLDMAHFAIGAPYPGTKFYALAKEKGWLISQKWEDFDQNYSAIVSYENLSADEIAQGIKNANKEWFLRPGPIFKILKEGLKDPRLAIILLKIGMGHLKWFFSKAPQTRGCDSC